VGDQTYSDIVQVANDTLLQGNDISITGAVNGPAGLWVNSVDQTSDVNQTIDTGSKTFQSPVGADVPLLSFSTNNNGTTFLNGGAVTTTDFQNFGGPILLGLNTVLTSTPGGRVTLGALGGSASPIIVSSLVV